MTCVVVSCVGYLVYADNFTTKAHASKACGDVWARASGDQRAMLADDALPATSGALDHWVARATDLNQDVLDNPKCFTGTYAAYAAGNLYASARINTPLLEHEILCIDQGGDSLRCDTSGDDADLRIPVSAPSLLPTITPVPVPSSLPSSWYSDPALPTPSAIPEIGPSARCRDGTLSYSQHRQGTCSHHGGVLTWLG